MNDHSGLPLTRNHWGIYRVETANGKATALHGFEEDVDPSPIGPGILDVQDGPTRIERPMVRQGWLEKGPGAAGEKRGLEPFVEVTWDEAERLVADELERVRGSFGNEAIFAGSYGWASAGRFHHAQSQLRRFLNCIGGFTTSVNSYSLAAGEVILPHVLGSLEFIYNATSWQSIVEECELLVAFGGVPLKNGQIAQGGVGRHRQREAVRQAVAAGVGFVNISPLKNDVLEEAGADWLAPRPGSDVAIMLALAHTLLSEELHDPAFLDRYTVGFERFASYLTGESDGQPKSAAWASDICELSAEAIVALARRMAASRTMISVSWSLTRQDHGEQPFWAAVTLAAMLGQIGLPGGGIGFGYSATNAVGLERKQLYFKPLPQGRNPVRTFIPVARITDLLMNPGGAFAYNGQTYRYPDTRLIYWVGGNPFHHHQDLRQLVRAWRRPETVIVHEWCWNALAKHADIVLPCTTTLEREDIGITSRDPYIVSMEKVAVPVGEARDEFDIYRGIAQKMGVEDTFTEGRDAADWQRWLYDLSRQSVAEQGVELPPLAELRRKGWHKIPLPTRPHVMLEDFRADPEAHPLKTPSGKIEIFSQTIEGFGYEDCPPHPTWLEPLEWLGAREKTYPLHLISNQPSTKLHSHLDHGAHSRASKVKERERILLNPEDAAARGIAEGDIVRVFNARGACLCGAALSESIRPGVVQISTGAWMDLDESGGLCKHGNANLLTMDKGTSQLAQGPIAHSCLVDLERFEGEPPPLTAFQPPPIVTRTD